MIAAFPSSYPDELLYSIIARFSERLSYPNKKSIPEDVFGTRNAIAVVDLPANIRSLTEKLPHNHPLNADRILNENTLLPLYAPFLPKRRLERIRKDMLSDHGARIHTRIGTVASRIKIPEWMRFCPECVAGDRKQYGECYWHRLHQVRGVEVCPKHLVFLVDSLAKRKNTETRHGYLCAEQTITEGLLRCVNSSSADHMRLVEIAKDVEWLLDHGAQFGSVYLSQKYKQGLSLKGLITRSGSIRVKDLQRQFSQYYSKGFLESMDCELGAVENWLLRIIRGTRKTQHPLQHIILIHFLGGKLAEFLMPEQKAKRKAAVFGRSPWPCLNRTCSNFMQLVIQSCAIRLSAEGHRPIGTFRCSCGFAYQRSGPDPRKENVLSIGRILDFGPVWEGELRRLWANFNLSLRRVSDCLGVDPLTAKRHAARLSLQFPRLGKRQTSGCSRPLAGARISPIEQSILQNQRLEWIAALKCHGTVRKARTERLALYSWLYRHDREWLRTLSKGQRFPNHGHLRIDWKRRDAEIAATIREEARHVISVATGPRITKTLLARKSGRPSIVLKHLDKLPQTAKAFDEYCEDRSCYALRRLSLAVLWFQDQNRIPKEWQLVRKAGLRVDMISRVEVREGIAKALELFIIERDHRVRHAG